MKICLVYNLRSGKEQNWINALKNRGIDYVVVDLSKNNWLEIIISGDFDLIIGLPNGALSYQKQLFDERMYVIKYVLGYPIYPFYDELLVYENKRMLSYFLKAKNIPHPKTDVFYDFDEAVEFTKKTHYPIVFKSNIGASGSGVHIVKNQVQAYRLIKKTFRGKGLPRRRGPNLVRKGAYQRIFSKLNDFGYIKSKLSHYKSIQDDREKRSLVIQEYVNHSHEWKNIIIGSSFFSHKKLVVKRKASGGYKQFDSPPIKLLNFIRETSNVLNFSTASIDVFEKDDGYLVNEVQTYFGQPLPYLMKVNGKIGRYQYINNQWVFEEGDFNSNHSCDLRLEHALELLRNNKL